MGVIFHVSPLDFNAEYAEDNAEFAGNIDCLTSLHEDWEIHSKLCHSDRRPVILSEAKNLACAKEILRFAQGDNGPCSARLPSIYKGGNGTDYAIVLTVVPGIARASWQ